MHALLRTFASVILIVTASWSAAPAAGQPIDWQWVAPGLTGHTLHDIERADASTLYLVGEMGTVLKSTDDGQSWSALPFPDDRDMRTASFVDASTGWVSGSWQDQGGGSTQAMFKTTDGGATWSVQYAGASINDIHFATPDSGVAVGDMGYIQYTTDGGETWMEALNGSFGSPHIHDVFFADTTGWAVASQGVVFKTSDTGQSWTRIDTVVTVNDWGSEIQLDLQGVHFLDAQNGWAVGNLGLSSAMLVSSNDGGMTWTSHDATFEDIATDITFFDEQHGWIIGEGYVATTDDGGETWTQHPSVHGPAAWNDVLPTGAETALLVGTGGAIGTTQDGGATVADNVLTGQRLNDLHFVDEQQAWAVGGADSALVLHTSDGGATWSRQDPGMGQYAALRGVYFKDAQAGWAVGRQGWAYDSELGIMETTNGGATWSPVDVDRNGFFPRSSNEFESITFVDEQHGWAVGSNLLIGTTDGGATWTILSQDVDMAQFFDAQHGVGFEQSDDVLMVTEDGGQTWTPVHTFDGHLDASTLAFVNTEEGWVFGEQGMAQYTADGGQTWTDGRTPSHEDIRASSFVDTDTGWVAGTDGLLASTSDGGQTWSTHWDVTRAGITNIVPVGDALWLLTDVGAMLRGTPTSGTDAEHAAPMPTAVALAPAYPNPFTQATTLHYDLPETAPVRLEVFDALGRRVATLVDEQQAAGAHVASFDAAALPAGVYLVRLEAAGRVDTQRMVRVR